MIKKITSVILAVIFILSVFTVSGGAVAESTATLKFNADGSFKMMLVADIQDDHHLIPATLEYFNNAIQSEKPDLVILLGDNISGVPSDFKDIEKARKNTAKAIDCYMSFFEEKEIPVAMVFGNHDAENEVTKEEQMLLYKKNPGCYYEIFNENYLEIANTIENTSSTIRLNNKENITINIKYENYHLYENMPIEILKINILKK